MVSNRFMRRSITAVAALSLTGTATYWACMAHAQDAKMMGEDKKMVMEKPMPLTADEQKMVIEHLDKMKMMASDPAKSKTMSEDLARMMVMHKMAASIAADPEVMKASKEMMMDPAVKKVHEDAMAMAMDPEQMKKIADAVKSDPEKMKMVIHESMIMAMHHDRPMDAGMREKMEDMKDKMDDKK